ncbi:hypothetical protein PSN45_001937 [Yamadazyma tenuis]|uniref:Uncharacterized protein n=1 Tax=Candida tenuis (strain ATCC 10573 / BCRC 21748 / CBS 615 / JCM 9827 / NBRC 10315 / NRRL Y-1498 / VKM Y-70) TaxID=590646 RepID=G3BDI6_CANTC|nr:uncharacterized protein CANTEDRAFT_116358 [Yamadazyma tenuis ATCC 10573]EGV60309.1 hypothetical protein CANTEDRAFT_116358 [Yamadazyma tenuis ATCC 10573]WEJ94453.1 hypothetical protein PSN45_001937 [Yamadazyma tenuis]
MVNAENEHELPSYSSADFAKMVQGPPGSLRFFRNRNGHFENVAASVSTKEAIELNKSKYFRGITSGSIGNSTLYSDRGKIKLHKEEVCDVILGTKGSTTARILTTDEDDIFYETSPVQECFDSIGTEDKPTMFPILTNGLIPDMNSPVEVIIEPTTKPLLPYNAMLDLSAINHNAKSMKVFGPLCNVIDYDPEELNDENALLNILNEEIVASMEAETENDHRSQSSDRSRIEEESWWYKVRSWFKEEEEAAFERYFNKYPWAKYFQRSLIENPISDLEDFENLFTK